MLFLSRWFGNGACFSGYYYQHYKKVGHYRVLKSLQDISSSVTRTRLSNELMCFNRWNRVLGYPPNLWLLGNMSNSSVNNNIYTNPITQLDSWLCLIYHKYTNTFHYALSTVWNRVSWSSCKVAKQIAIFSTLNEAQNFIFQTTNSDTQIIIWVAKFVHRAMNYKNDDIFSKDQIEYDMLGWNSLW